MRIGIVMNPHPPRDAATSASATSYVVHCLNERFNRWFWPGRQPDRERVLKSVTERVAPASLYSLTRTVVRA